MIRTKRSEEEKKLNEERERNRIKGAKDMLDIKRKMEEEQRKLHMMDQKKEKMAFEKDKQRMLE